VEIPHFPALGEMIDVILHRSAVLLDEGAEIGFGFGVFEVGNDSEFIRKAVPDVVCRLELIDFEKFSVVENIEKCFLRLLKELTAMR